MSQQLPCAGGRYSGSFADCLDKARVWAEQQMLMTSACQAFYPDGALNQWGRLDKRRLGLADFPSSKET